MVQYQNLNRNIAIDAQYSLTNRKENHHFLKNIHNLLVLSYFMKMGFYYHGVKFMPIN